MRRILLLWAFITFVAANVSGQAIVETFLDADTSGTSFFPNPSRIGTEIRTIPAAQGVTVDQSGNVIFSDFGGIHRVSRNRIYLDTTVLEGENIVSDPIGRVLAAKGMRSDGGCASLFGPPNQDFLLFSAVSIGTCQAGNRGDGGPASAATFDSIGAIGMDRQGNAYLYDAFAGRVRVVGADGTIRHLTDVSSLFDFETTIGEVQVMQSDSGPGIIGLLRSGQLVRLHAGGVTALPDMASSPFAVDFEDNFYYFRNSDGALIRRSPSGAVTVIGLNGTEPFREGIAAGSMRYPDPYKMAADTAGNMYMIVRSSDAAGVKHGSILRIRTGLGVPDCTFSMPTAPTSAPANGGPLSFQVAASRPSCQWLSTSDVPWITFPSGARHQGNLTLGIQVEPNTGADRSGIIQIAGQKITVMQPRQGGGGTGSEEPIISTYTGTAGVTGTSNSGTQRKDLLYNWIGQFAFDSLGNMYIVETQNRRVWRIDRATGVGTIVAGDSSAPATSSGDGGHASQAQFTQANGITVDRQDRVYVGDRQAVRRFRVGGSIESLTAPSASSLYFDPMRGQLLVKASGGIYRLQDSTAQLIARDLTAAGPASPDGTALDQAAFRILGPAFADLDGNLYLSDYGDRKVRYAGTDGIVRTIAGNGLAGSTGDGGSALQARVNDPWGLAKDYEGNLFIAELSGNRVRKVLPNGMIETVAGNGEPGASGDGGPARLAAIGRPEWLAFDPAGDLYIGTTTSIRKVTFPKRAFTLASAASGVGGLVAVGSIISAYGSAMATQTLLASTGGQRELAGVTVTVTDSKGQTFPSSLLFVSPQQVNFVIPEQAAEGYGSIRVQTAQGTALTARLALVRVSPGLFLASADGLLAANVIRVLPSGEQRVESPFRLNGTVLEPVPVDVSAPGETVVLILYGTGIRARERLEDVKVAVGGIEVAVSYAGAQRQFEGLDQINVVLPSTLAGAGKVGVTVTVGGVIANLGSIVIR